MNFIKLNNDCFQMICFFLNFKDIKKLCNSHPSFIFRDYFFYELLNIDQNVNTFNKPNLHFKNITSYEINTIFTNDFVYIFKNITSLMFGFSFNK